MVCKFCPQRKLADGSERRATFNHIGDINEMVIMKLYTEEQLKEALWKQEHPFSDGKNVDEIVALITPIELPTDEEIEEELFHQSNEYAYGYKDAFQWLRTKILNK